MPLSVRSAVLFLAVSGFLSAPISAQGNLVRRENSDRSSLLTGDDGLAVIAAALDSQRRANARADCSHLVHTIYEHAGFPYSYVSSAGIYRGTSEFQRVTHPRPGDLVVWPGHVGIVVNPAQRVFFSKLRRGPGIDAYDAQYWKERGQVRFYRYIKSSPTHVATTRIVR